jgi:hypothetical protein
MAGRYSAEGRAEPPFSASPTKSNTTGIEWDGVVSGVERACAGGRAPDFRGGLNPVVYS